MKPETGDVPKSAEDSADESFVEATMNVSNPIVPVHR